MTSLSSRLPFIWHLCVQDVEDILELLMVHLPSSSVHHPCPVSHMTQQNLPHISYDPSLLMTITDVLSPITMTSVFSLCLLTMSYTLCLWWSHITHNYDLSPLMALISHDLSSITMSYDLWPLDLSSTTHHTWVWLLSLMTMSITHDHLDSWLSSMTSLIYDYHSWPYLSLMTIVTIMTYDILHMTLITHDHHSWRWFTTITCHIDLSPMTMLLTHDLSPFMTIPSYTDLWPHLWLMTYDLWPMTCDLWIWLSRMTYDYDLWSSPITSDYHLPLITITHVLSITMTYHIWALLMTIIYDYHIWVSHMTITCDYDLITHDYVHHLWTSGLMPYALHLMIHHLWVSHKTVTHDYHPWLCSPQLTMSITNEHDYHPWTWLPPMTMNITHNLSPLMTSSHHSWSITSPMTSSHHSWLSPLCVTYDCHRCLISRVDHFSPMTLITQDHHSWPSPKTITHDHDYHSLLVTMTSYFWLTPMSSLLCLSLMSMTYDHHDYDYDLSLVTITSDHHPWLWLMTIRSDHLTSHPWLLTHGY